MAVPNWLVIDYIGGGEREKGGGGGEGVIKEDYISIIKNNLIHDK